MTILTRISNYFHFFISKFLNEDDDDRADRSEDDLDRYVVAMLDRELNGENNAIQMTRARTSSRAA